MHFLNAISVTAELYYIIVEFWKVCCGRELRAGNMSQGVKEEIVD